MKRAWFVAIVLVYMLAAGTAMAEMDTPDEGGGRPGWWMPKRTVYDIGSPWRGGNMRGKARPWVSLGYTVKPVSVETLMSARQSAKR